MTKLCRGAGLLAVCLAAAANSTGYAKPPDLPDENTVRCQEAREDQAHLRVTWDAAAGQLRVDVEANGQPVAEPAPMWLEVWCPTVVPLLLQRLGERLQSGEEKEPAQGERSRPLPPIRSEQCERDSNTSGVYRSDGRQDDEGSAEQARQYFEIACRFIRAGKFEQARDCLREAHIANPTCRFGRMAMDRLLDMESSEPCEQPGIAPVNRIWPRRHMTEEPPLSEEPQSDDDEMSQAERAFRRMRETTKPLGLVLVPTY